MKKLTWLLGSCLLAVLLSMIPLGQHAMAQVGPPNAEFVFEDGFETGDLDKWSGDHGLEIQQEEVFNGIFALRGQTTGVAEYVRTKLPREEQTLFYRVHFKILSQDSQNSVNLLRFRTTDNAAILALYVSSTGRLGYRNDIHGTTVESPVVVKRGEWHQAQVQVHIEGDASTVNVWLDANPVAELSRQDALGDAGIGRLELGDSATGRTYDIVYDDVLVDTKLIPSSAGPRPIPAVITVRTVPEKAGVKIQLDNTIFVTGADGVAQVQVDQLTLDMRSRIKLLDSELDPQTSVKFDRWYGVFPGTKVAATLKVNKVINFSFVDLDGKAIDPNRITSVKFKSSHGVVHSLRTADLSLPQWFQSSRVVPSQEGLLNKELYYTLDSVIIDGANVVNRSQQRFMPSETTDWNIQLLFYPAKVRARDALFGFPIGSAVTLEFPDGEIRRLPLDANAEVTTLLPRGVYRVNVEGPGLSPSSPLAMTRSQEVALKVISYLDIFVIVLGLALLAFSLLFAGRPGLIPFYGRRLQPVRVGAATDYPVASRFRGKKWHVLLGLSVVALIAFVISTAILGNKSAVQSAQADNQIAEANANNVAGSIGEQTSDTSDIYGTRVPVTPTPDSSLGAQNQNNPVVAVAPAAVDAAPTATTIPPTEVVPTATIPPTEVVSTETTIPPPEVVPTATMPAPTAPAAAAAAPNVQPSPQPFVALDVLNWYKVRPGDTLAHISERFYGNSRGWRRIYEANRDIIPNPNSIEVGRYIRIP